MPDAADEAAYIAARTPAASVVLSASAAGSGNTNSVVKALSAGRALTAASVASTIQPVIANGAATIVSLTPSASAPSATPVSQSTSGAAFKTVPAKTARPGATSASSSTAATSPPLAVVTLNYGVAWAGQTVALSPLSGGVISSTDASGNVYSSSSELLLNLDSTGALTFGFQAPAASKTYQVFTRLDTVATTFTFTVPDPGGQD